MTFDIVVDVCCCVDCVCDGCDGWLWLVYICWWYAVFVYDVDCVGTCVVVVVGGRLC